MNITQGNWVNFFFEGGGAHIREARRYKTAPGVANRKLMTKRVPLRRLWVILWNVVHGRKRAEGTGLLTEEGRSVHVAVMHTWAVSCADNQLSLLQVLLYNKYHL